MTEHLCPYPIVVGTTWRCACRAHWMQPLIAPDGWTPPQPKRRAA